uniref:ANAPC4_WD40 domain-containing protein n=1 Tax=Soboliphyme baturini TaxID=241478 RepID=A0A183IHK8_9BILA
LAVVEQVSSPLYALDVLESDPVLSVIFSYYLKNLLQHTLVKSRTPVSADESDMGIVTVLNMEKCHINVIFIELSFRVFESLLLFQVDTRSIEANRDAVVAHFPAHLEDRIGCLKFSPNGMLLLTGDIGGRVFNVFKIFPHPNSSAMTAVHHLYILYRGSTAAQVSLVACCNASMTFLFALTCVGLRSLRRTGQRTFFLFHLMAVRFRINCKNVELLGKVTQHL